MCQLRGFTHLDGWTIYTFIVFSLQPICLISVLSINLDGWTIYLVYARRVLFAANMSGNCKKYISKIQNSPVRDKKIMTCQKIGWKEIWQTDKLQSPQFPEILLVWTRFFQRVDSLKPMHSFYDYMSHISTINQPKNSFQTGCFSYWNSFSCRR